MINKLVIATGNEHKVKEIEMIFKDVVREVLSLPKNAPQVVEDGKSFIENSKIKAFSSYNFTGIPSISDDSGLCVEALGGMPGIFSARYGGENVGYERKIDMLLRELKDKDIRKAYFVTAAVCVLDNNYYIALEGRVYGTIIDKPRGINGFGYDPVFLPDGFNKTYGEMSFEEKNSISHRYLAMEKMKNILSNIYYKK